MNSDKTTKLLLFLVLIALIVLIINTLRTDDGTEAIEKAVKRIEEKIDEDFKERDDLWERIESRSDSSITLIKQLDSNRVVIQQINQNTNEQIGEIEEYDVGELYKFFMERYSK